MSRVVPYIRRIGYNVSNNVRCIHCRPSRGGYIGLNRISKRRLTDRSFRLANVGDLRVAQEFKDQVAPEHYVTFAHTADVRQRDLDKQIVIDLSHEQGYKRGHIKGAINLPLEKFDFCRLVDTYGGIMQDEIYAVFKSLGVGNDTSEIILYDNSGLV